MPHAAMLLVHIAAGTVGLLLGPVAMYQDSKRLTAGERATGYASGLYRVAVLVGCVSAVGLVLGYRHELWWLVPISGLTYGLAVLARVSP
jgi:hypothetical protein